MRNIVDEGQIFSFPIGEYFACGIIIRRVGSVAFAFFYSAVWNARPSFDEIRQVIHSENVIYKVRIGLLGFDDNTWVVEGKLPDWNRLDWQVPKMLRTEPITVKKYLDTYDDQLKYVRSESVESEVTHNLPPNSLLGHLIVEKRLKTMLIGSLKE